MRKFIVCMFLSSLFCFADVVYFRANSKIINCKVAKEDEGAIYVNTFVDSGVGQMKIVKSIIDVVEYLPIDSTRNSKTVKKTKDDYSRVNEIKKEQLRKQKEQERILRAQQQKALERFREQHRKKRVMAKSIIKGHEEETVSEDSVIYYIEPNVPLLATGAALTTFGIMNVIATINLSNTISEAENSINENPELGTFFEEIYLNPLKRSRRQAIIYATVFSVAGALDIYFSFEKVSVDISGNQLNLSYNF